MVYRLLGELVATSGTTLVVVSHDETATELADRVVHVRDGRISGEVLRGDDPKLVVGRGGWVRLPESARAQAAIGNRVRWRADEDEVRLAGDGSVVEGAPGRRARARRARRGHLRAAGNREELRHRPAGAPGAGRVRREHGARRTRGGRRALGLREDDAAPLDRGPRAPGCRLGHRRGCRPRRPRPGGARRAPPRAHRLGRARSPASSRSRRRSRTRCSASSCSTAGRPRNTSPRRARGSSGSAWPTASTARPIASRRASASGSRSRARSRGIPTSCCSTSRPRGSTRRAPRSSPICSVTAARVSQAAVICATHDALLTQRADVVLRVGTPGQSSPR